jgi:membrane protein DedA with SNARE-associated domain
VELTSQLTTFINYLHTLPGVALLLFFGFSNFLENVFPPWPGDSFTVFSGFLASKPDSNFNLVELGFATLFGNWLGALLMFYFGKRVILFLRHSEISFVKKNYNEESFEKTVVWFRKYSGLLIVLSRFSAGVRFFVAIVAGMSKMSSLLFLFYYTIAISVWCGLLISSGYKLGKNWDQILVMLSAYNQFISIFIIALVFIGSGYYFFRKKEQS